MPLGLFTNKFSPKLGAPRKTPSLSNLNLDAAQRNAEFGVENYGPIKLKLGSNEMVFEGGKWISGKTYFFIYCGNKSYKFGVVCYLSYRMAVSLGLEVDVVNIRAAASADCFASSAWIRLHVSA